MVEWEGIGTVEAWTTPVNRDGQPEKAFLAVRTPDGSRSLAVITDPASVQATVREDIAGVKVAVAPTAPRPCDSRRAARVTFQKQWSRKRH